MKSLYLKAFFLVFASASLAFGDDHFSIVPVPGNTLSILGPNGEQVAQFDGVTVSKSVTVGDSTVLVSCGQDVNDHFSVIVQADPVSSHGFHFNVLGRSVTADKDAVVTLAFSQNLDRVKIDPGLIGIVQVEAPSHPHHILVEKSRPASIHPAIPPIRQAVAVISPHNLEPLSPPKPVVKKHISASVVSHEPGDNLAHAYLVSTPSITVTPAVPVPAPAKVDPVAQPPLPAAAAEADSGLGPLPSQSPATGKQNDSLPASNEVASPGVTPPLVAANDDSTAGSDINLTPVQPVPPQALPKLPQIELNLPQQYSPVLPSLSQEQQNPLFQPTMFVKKFLFKGNSVFDSAKLALLLQKYTGRNITGDELEAARQTLTLYYVSHGYINSGAILPDQDPKDGVILFQIVEGRLTKVEVSGQHWFQTWWLRNQMRQAAGTPLNFNKLKQGMQVLRENPNIAQVNAELQPGGVPGESDLKMEVKDKLPFRFSVELNNYRPPSVGSMVAEVHAADLNLTGNNDPLTINYGIANSNSNGFELSQLDNIGADYAFPVSPWGTTMELGADRNNAGIIQAPFNQIDINSKLTEYHFSLHQPVFETPQRTLIVTLAVDDRRNETSLFGIPFSLSPGAVNGVEQVFVPRFIQEYVDRSQNHVFSARSQLSMGLGLFNSTVDAGPPDGHFVDWLGQTQYIQRLGTSDNLIILRLNGQIADRPLLSLEQFELGGISSVRGYLENQALRDNGIIASVEARFPLLEDKDHNALIAIAPFSDFGLGWDNVETTGGGAAATNNLGTQAVAMPSVGTGILFNPWKYVSGQLYWGYALNRRQVPDGNGLQYDGLEFSVVVTAF